jgi:hypothetical protein
VPNEQTAEFAALGIGAAGDPSLEPGVHLRWTFDPSVLGFPPGGFLVARRPAATGPLDPMAFIGTTVVDVTSFTVGSWQFESNLPMSTATDPVLGWSLALAADAEVTVRATDGTLMRILELDEVHESGALTLSAVDRGVTVDARVSRITGARRTLRVSADRFESVTIKTTSPSAITNLARLNADYDLTTGWTALTLPILLPANWTEASVRIPPADRPRIEDGYDQIQALISALPGGPRLIRSEEQSFLLQPLKLLLGLATAPIAARLLGLYFVDITAVAGTSYDYLVTGLWPVPRVFVCFGLQSDRAPAVQTPTNLTALVRARSSGAVGGVLHGPSMGVDLAWSIPDRGDMLRTSSAAAYHVDRALRTPAGVWPPSTRLTKRHPIAPCRVDGRFPSPTFRDSAVGNGLFRYTVTGVDLFGRESAPTAAVEIEVSDTRGTPPPFDVEADVDQTAAGEVRLRATWRWTPALRRQASDAVEFRVLYDTTNIHAGIDRSRSENWEGTFATLPVGANVRHTLAPTAGFPLATTLAKPVAYALVGVCTVDRAGNLGPVSPPVTVALRRRERPAAPAFGSGSSSEVVYATAADYLGKSRYTVTWTSADPDLLYDVYRASDEAIFALARQSIGQAFQRGDYAQDDPLLQLALNPICAAAFTRVTAKGVQGPAGTMLSFVDVLDGRANRSTYGRGRTRELVEARVVYRVLAADRAGNRSDLSAGGTLVHVRDVTPPARPAVTRVAAGASRITIEWQKNRDEDLAEYRLYRADSAYAAADARTMTVVATLAEDDTRLRVPTAGRVAYDDPVAPLADVWYRLTAVDHDGNESIATDARRGRAYEG